MSNEIFNYVVSLCFIVIAGCTVYMAVRLTATITRINHILDEIKGVTDEIEIFKQGIKMGLVQLITSLVSRINNRPTKEVKTDE
jgi:hypothetical protein